MPTEKDIMVEDLINTILANPELVENSMDFNAAIDNAILIKAMLSNPELMGNFMDFNAAIDNAIDELGLSEDEAVDYVCNRWDFDAAADLMSEVE